MNFVQPIRSKTKLEEMKDELKKNGTRDFLMFYTGINPGLRVSDIVKLKYDGILKKILKKYSPIGELTEFATGYAETLSKTITVSSSFPASSNDSTKDVIACSSSILAEM